MCEDLKIIPAACTPWLRSLAAALHCSYLRCLAAFLLEDVFVGRGVQERDWEDLDSFRNRSELAMNVSSGEEE